jgi:hypothetical protein
VTVTIEDVTVPIEDVRELMEVMRVSIRGCESAEKRNSASRGVCRLAGPVKSPVVGIGPVGICIKICSILLHYLFKFKSGGFRLHIKPSVKEQASYRPYRP